MIWRPFFIFAALIIEAGFLPNSAVAFDCKRELQILKQRTELVLRLMKEAKSEFEFVRRYHAELPSVLPPEMDRVNGIEIFVPVPNTMASRLEINAAYVMEAMIHRPLTESLFGALIDKKSYAGFRLLREEYQKLYGDLPGSELFLAGLQAIDYAVLYNSAFVTATKGPTARNAKFIPESEIVGFLRIVRILPQFFKIYKQLHPAPLRADLSLKDRLLEAFSAMHGPITQVIDSHLPLELRSGVELERKPNEVIEEIGRLTIRKGYSPFIAARLFRELFLLAYQPWDGIYATTFYLEADAAHVRLFKTFGFQVIPEIKLQEAVGEKFYLMKGDRSNLERAIQIKEDKFRRIVEEMYGVPPILIP